MQKVSYQLDYNFFFDPIGGGISSQYATKYQSVTACVFANSELLCSDGIPHVTGYRQGGHLSRGSKVRKSLKLENIS